MNRQNAIFKPHEDVLAITFERQNSAPFDFGYRRSAQDARCKELGLHHRMAGKLRGELSNNGFDFGELGHVPPLWKIGQDVVALNGYGKLSQLY